MADDHPVYRSGVVRGLGARPDLVVVGDHGDGESALQAIIELEPDVALLDVQMPRQDGLSVLRAVKARELPTAVVLLTGSQDGEGLYAALAAGANGYLIKTEPADVIADAVAAAARGEVRFPAGMQATLAAHIRAREELTHRTLLSDRETEVLRLTAAGGSAADIATELYLSLPTVRTHLQHTYRKLQVSDRAAAVAAGLRLGLID